MTKVPLLIGVVIATALAALAPVGQTAASTEVDQSQLTGHHDFCIQPNVGSACYNGGAQTFTSGVTGHLVAVEILVSRQSFTTTTRDLVVELRADRPDGALLATGTPVPADEIPVEPGEIMLPIRFPEPPHIEAGDVVAIVIPYEPMSTGYDPAWRWAQAEDDLYAGGVTWGGTDGHGWEAYDDGSDLVFATWMSQEPTPSCQLTLDGSDGPSHSVGIPAWPLVQGFDFGQDADVGLEIRPPGAVVREERLQADFAGSLAFSLEFRDGDAGTWTVSAFALDAPACSDELTIDVRAAETPPPVQGGGTGSTPTPTPTPAPTPTFTPTPTASRTPSPTPSPSPSESPTASPSPTASIDVLPASGEAADTGPAILLFVIAALGAAGAIGVMAWQVVKTRRRRAAPRGPEPGRPAGQAP